jgi:hypothetical protein
MGVGKLISFPRVKSLLPLALAVGAFWLVMRFFTGTACLLASFTGLPCPSCGITRAAAALLRGDLASSFRFYPPLIPLLLLAAFSAAVFPLKEKKLLIKIAERVQIAFVVLVLLVYAVRMILYFPETEPMNFNGDGILPRLFGGFFRL